MLRRGSSSEDTDSTTTASRRDSEDSDSGVGNLSEKETQHLGNIRQNTIEAEIEDEAPDKPGMDMDYSSVPMAGLPLVGAMFGLCLGGPVGLLAGVKLGGVAAVGGSILGYTGASVIKEQKEMRTYIDDHYKKQPDLYVLTPREEAILNRRRLSERTPPDSPRHLPSIRRSGSSCRRGPAGYRANCIETRSANSSPVSRRKFDPNSPVSRRKFDPNRRSPALARRNTYNQTPPRQTCEMRQPPNLHMRQFRRLGDLSEDEQRSVVALISTQGSGPRSSRTYTVTAHVCDSSGSEHHNVVLHSASSNSPKPLDVRRKNFARQQKIRASSLPDVLEEDSLSNKS
eukprot:TRINITY_DN33853_c0_g1_i1.p1 TRINITY_DN33853_c0_g1~~TRINITY_DN33853_c0_g1_i1.p1  ORF type:complete len:342 (-),score=85.99 TRINITY_DN33853_c0_g1_i1:104-1129(-)